MLLARSKRLLFPHDVALARVRWELVGLKARIVGTVCPVTVLFHMAKFCYQDSQRGVTYSVVAPRCETGLCYVSVADVVHSHGYSTVSSDGSTQK